MVPLILTEFFLVFPIMNLYKHKEIYILELFSFPFCTANNTFFLSFCCCFVLFYFFGGGWFCCFFLCLGFYFIAAKSCTVLCVNLCKFKNVLIHIFANWQVIGKHVNELI